ncbi:MAG: cytochrome c biogenesis protein CcdA [Thermofilaceae archaeon]
MNGEFHSVVLSLFAGLQTVFSPCLFPVLPAYLIFLARQVGSSLKVTLAFVTALSASLLVYATIVASVGQALLIALSLTPDTISFVLATLYACLAFIELSPAKQIFSAFTYRGLEVKKVSVASSAMLGALFALAAAPCASAPLLAWTAILLLHPNSVLPSLTAFLAGVATPFIIIGALAQSMGQRLHRGLARSFLVKYSYELSAILFAAFSLIVLLSTSNPLSIIEKYVQMLSTLVLALLSPLLFYAGINLLTSVPRAARGGLLILATFPILTGITGATNLLLRSQVLPVVFNKLIFHYLIASIGVVTAALWLFLSIKNGGRASRWIALSALAQTLCIIFTDLSILLPFRTEASLSHYLLCIISVGAALSLLTILVQAKRLA